MNLGARIALVSVIFLATPSTADAAHTSFKHPGAMALDRYGHLWIANQDKFGITEIDARSGKIVRLVDAKADGFIDPTGIATTGDDVWVVSGSVEYDNGTSDYGMVTELDARTGDLVRTINLKPYGVTGLSAVSADDQHVWVNADGGARVAEISRATGKVDRIFEGRHRFVEPGGIYSNGRQVWISSLETSEGIVERSASSGAKIRTITPMAMVPPPGGGNKLLTYLGPQSVTADANYVWTGNESGANGTSHGASVTQINASTGKIIRTIATPADRFFGVIHDVDSDGAHVWVVNGAVGTPDGQRGDTVTELNTSDGSLVRVIRLNNGEFSDPDQVVSDGVDVWVTDQGGGTGQLGNVIELNASSGTVVRIIGG